MPASRTSASRPIGSRNSAAKHLGHLDEVAYEFFGSALARDAVHQKVSALFPPHEIEEFTELFWGRIQTWREQEGARREGGVALVLAAARARGDGGALGALGNAGAALSHRRRRR